tara:strand:+ start:71 stop:928 length:858 start_codon:yes stop_codon:yes gene_type:complete
MAQTEVKISSDTNQVYIGDIINVNIQVLSTEQILWPDIEEVISTLEIQNSSSIDSSVVKSRNMYSQDIAIQQFDTGNYVLPQLPFLNFKGDTFYSDSLFFSFLAFPLDTTNAIFDIKAPKKVPFNLAEAKPYIYGFVGFILLCLILFYLIQRFKNKDIAIEEPVELIPCEIEAINALKELESQSLCKKGLVKDHYIQLTTILRRYFDREYEIYTLESTTDETIEALTLLKLDPKLVDDISNLLREADYVKFAKSKPDTKTNNAFMRKSYSIVEECHKLKEEVQNV